MDDAHIGRIDLDACDREPIHFIGSVQPHGALLAADLETLHIAYASENIAGFIGLDVADVLDRPLADVIGRDALDHILAASLEPAMPEYLRPWFARVANAAGQSSPYEIYAHAFAGRLIVEFLRPEIEPESVWREDGLRQSIIAKLTRPGAIDELSRVSAEIVRTVTRMDRVMIYRFAPDNHGEVIAESTSRPDSFLGLHYPASDIPEPARRHFLLNIIRNIPDIRAPHARIIARGGEAADADAPRPLDLSYAKLRGISPVHIQYLTNMGVGASLSISLLANGRLWGLIACHHYRPHDLTSSQIRFVELLGATISTFLQSLENTAKLERSIAAERLASRIETAVGVGMPLRDAISEQAGGIMQLMRADGLSLAVGGEQRHAGHLPPSLPDFTPLRRNARDGLATDANLSVTLTLASEHRRSLAGAAILELSDDGADHLALTRREFVETIRWAGKPEKHAEIAPDGNARLSPRGSFAVWSEERVGHSEPFDDGDRDAGRILRRALFALNSLERERAAVAAQRAAERDQQRLRHQMLEAARKSSLGELASALAHELSQPLFAVSNYVSASRRELENLGLPLTEKIESMMSEAVTDAMRAADLVRRIRDFITGGDLERRPTPALAPLRQGVELALVSATLEGLEIRYDVPHDLPPVLVDQVQISLVILNLVRNAIAAMEASPARAITIRARQVGNRVRISIADTGPGIAPDMLENLFEPFHTSTTRGMGIGLSLCRSIVEAHGGRIWLQPADEGAKFAFTLPIARDLK
jgi:light-regulated signal transduction histidine kinase (bacteriophytochrome)